MGQQSNKVIKRRRRLSYLKRRNEREKANLSLSRSAPKGRKSTAKTPASGKTEADGADEAVAKKAAKKKAPAKKTAAKKAPAKKTAAKKAPSATVADAPAGDEETQS